MDKYLIMYFNFPKGIACAWNSCKHEDSKVFI